MLILTPKGLYCRAGDFYIDPKGAVDHAVVTHAHSDHARRGSRHYYCAASGESLLRARIGKYIKTSCYEFGSRFRLGDVVVSFHPAGHILGSSQVRIECGGEVWVASGDYKRDPDPTCEPFEVVTCDVFVTEATFGTPAYIWDKNADLGKEISEWWSENARDGINSVLFAYSLGKAQRVLGLLEPHARRPVICHSAATPLNDCYRAQGIRLAPTRCLSEVSSTEKLRGELLLVPQSFLNTEQAGILEDNYKTAFASGWMANRFQNSYDRGFLLSDHADWNDLVRTVQESGAKQVFVQHRGKGALVKHLNKLGIRAFPETALIPQDSAQLGFF
jgi:putative mRNA 3-end processing factor